MSKLHILVVDDDALAARALARIIESEGHRATVLVEPTEALRLVRRLAVDVIISDQRMPTMQGTEILASLARLRPETFRVLMSCELQSDSLVDLVNEARLDYLLRKPFRIEHVRALLRTAQNERRSPSTKPTSSSVFLPRPTSFLRDETGAIVLAA